MARTRMSEPNSSPTAGAPTLDKLGGGLPPIVRVQHVPQLQDLHGLLFNPLLLSDDGDLRIHGKRHGHGGDAGELVASAWRGMGASQLAAARAASRGPPQHARLRPRQPHAQSSPRRRRPHFEASGGAHDARTELGGALGAAGAGAAGLWVLLLLLVKPPKRGRGAGDEGC